MGQFSKCSAIIFYLQQSKIMVEENKGSSEKEKAQRGLSGEMRLVTLQLRNGETQNFYGKDVRRRSYETYEVL